MDMDLNYKLQKMTVVLEKALAIATPQAPKQPKYSKNKVKGDRSYYCRQSLSFFRYAYKEVECALVWILNQLILINSFIAKSVFDHNYYSQRLHSFISWRAFRVDSQRGPPNT
ncbi:MULTISPECIES: hypothetical protein [Pseudoalteromonas]|uniref:hypothetical protein n=1 Tax=Pseudoalteromonas TaxID=53246 RepID=UPI00036E595D|nr:MULTISPECIES: hypothetical protein [Pseudoalteromonas]MCF6143567.1 hypothetical protein [Pseudoalteromonas mariniglutinosa NCIMB 1770]